jgi:hypothetical protein
MEKLHCAYLTRLGCMPAHIVLRLCYKIDSVDVYLHCFPHNTQGSFSQLPCCTPRIRKYMFCLPLTNIATNCANKRPLYKSTSSFLNTISLNLYEAMADDEFKIAHQNVNIDRQ